MWNHIQIKNRKIYIQHGNKTKLDLCVSLEQGCHSFWQVRYSPLYIPSFKFYIYYIFIFSLVFTTTSALQQPENRPAEWVFAEWTL
jgi:hypothetical protein